MPETWIPIPNFPNYKCSSTGGVKNVVSGVILKGHVSRKNLREFTLRDAHGRPKSFLAHALVAQLFIGPTPPGHVIAHRSDDKLDNSPGNLVFLTRKELNERTRARLPLRTAFNRGAAHRLAKLDDAMVRAIRATRLGGAKFRELAGQFGVSTTTVYRVLFGVSWKHVV